MSECSSIPLFHSATQRSGVSAWECSSVPFLEGITGNELKSLAV